MIAIKPTVPTSVTNTSDSLTSAVEDKGFGVIDNAKPASYASLSDKQKQVIEKLSESSYNYEGAPEDMPLYELNAGGQKFVVAVDQAESDDEVMRESVTFVDQNGLIAGRAVIDDIFGDGFKMKWEDGRVIADPVQAEDISSSFKQAVEKYNDDHGSDDNGLGEDVETKDLPAAVRYRFESFERTIADGCDAEKFQVDGKTVYVLHDRSCVQTHYFVTPGGKLITDVCDG